MENITRSRRKSKTDRDFPLWLHPSGRWCRKVRGRFHYFGRDREGALEEWLRVKDDLLAGRERSEKDEGLTIADLCNRFLTAKRHLLDTRELAQRTWQSYYASCAKLVAAFGKSRLASGLTAGDFEHLRAKLAKGRGPVSLRGDVLTIRMVLKYGYDNGLIANPIRYGQGFKIPDKATLRRARQSAGARMLEAHELRQVIAAAPLPLQAMILLGINCAFGATDCASLPEGTLDLDTGWETFPRPKPAIERRAPLWPETVIALRQASCVRKEVKNLEDAGLVFVTRCGQRWVRVGPEPTDEKRLRKALKKAVAEGKSYRMIGMAAGLDSDFIQRFVDGRSPIEPAIAGKIAEAVQLTGRAIIDSVSCEFAKVLKRCGLERPRLGFYALRHTFRTIADEMLDRPAIDRIMGHRDGSMADAYRERISDERLRAVTDHVRKWLLNAE